MDHKEISLDAVNSQLDEYARANGLSVDSQGDVSPLFDHVQGTQLLSDEQTDDTSLPQLHIPYLVPRNEQLTISKECLELLSSVTSLGRDNEQEFNLPASRNFTRLKLELPLLRSDPEHDCRELARCVKEQRGADIDLTSVPSEPLDTSNDESLDFPDTAYQYKQKLRTEIQDEKLDIPRKVLCYFASTLKDEWTRDKQHELEDTLLHRKAGLSQRLQDLTITPPLSPCDYHEDFFIPDEQACQIPISSDPSTLLEGDIDRAEADLLQQDECLDTPTPLDLESPPTSSSGDLPLLEPKRSNISLLKVEGPLTPLNSLPSSSELAIDMSDFTKGVDIDQVLEEQQSGQIDETTVRIPDKIFSDDTLALLEDKAAEAKRNIEQEQLQSADAIARIEIPTMDFSIPVPDWQKVTSDAASQLACIEKTYGLFKILPWPKNFQAERELRWSPFPSRMGHISLNELIDGDDNAGNLFDCPGVNEVKTSADYVWKKPGLAILRELEEESEQSEPPWENGDDINIESLVRKRRLESTNLDLEHDNSSGSASPVSLIHIPENPTSISSQLPNLLLSYNDSSATSTLVSNHINFHTSKRQKNTRSSFFPSFTKSVAQVEEKKNSEVAAAIKLEAKNTSQPNPKPKPEVPTPCPKYQPASVPTKIIKTLTLERGVFSRLEKFYPNAEIIERDFDRWNTLTWDRNSVSRSPIVSPLAAEADIIVSPTTGIVVTTLLKAIQKPAPGHKSLAAIRERIRSIALRYERLIVLVSEGNSIDETARDLVPSECAAYAEFSGFVVGQDTNAHVYYVGGGNYTLTKWLVSFLTRYAPEADRVKDVLIQEETLWELFLRRAGLNAYAAQAILGQLKAPDNIPEEEGGNYGLPKFIRMAPVERVEMFRGVMGGERVLRRVNEVLETRWS
ncbi:hypothetical protein F4781DRAFT_427216 [Annulohypoxylon bovei var. microspora]|nr:hypothetical protein F4781DRAFT_427216 [Annulohypoxylon bovei var. microspora]